MSGYVYVLENKSFGDMVKVGYTRDPEYRLQQFRNHFTQLPFPTEFTHLEETDYPEKLELRVHHVLSSKRVDERKEFFSVTPKEAKSCIRQCHEDLLEEHQKLELSGVLPDLGVEDNRTGFHKSVAEVFNLLYSGRIREDWAKSLICGTDLLNRITEQIGVKKNLQMWLKLESTKEFIESLEASFDHVVEVTHGRNGATWLHPMLALDFALSVDTSTKLALLSKIDAPYEGDSNSYKEMCDALYKRVDRESDFKRYLMKLTAKIKATVGVDDWNKATTDQLKARDELHNKLTAVFEYARSPDSAVKECLAKVENKMLDF